MKHSIKRQMIAVFIGLIVCMLLLLLLCVGSWLEPYYIREKEENFGSSMRRSMRWPGRGV